jgi:hypothetical protein
LRASSPSKGVLTTCGPRPFVALLLHLGIHASGGWPPPAHARGAPPPPRPARPAARPASTAAPPPNAPHRQARVADARRVLLERLVGRQPAEHLERGVAQQLQLAVALKLRRRRGQLRRDGVEHERQKAGVLLRVQQLDVVLDDVERLAALEQRCGAGRARRRGGGAKGLGWPRAGREGRAASGGARARPRAGRRAAWGGGPAPGLYGRVLARCAPSGGPQGPVRRSRVRVGTRTHSPPGP